KRGDWFLARLDTTTRKLTPVDLPYTFYAGIRATGDRVVFHAASPTSAAAVVQLDLDTGKSQVLRRSADVTIDPGYLSIPEAIESPTAGGKPAHGFFYRPRNRDYAAPTGEKPPLIVKSHGGPTGATSSVLSLSTQYWTSRGFAVLDVNYGGST